MAKPDTKIDPDAQAPSPETPATDAEGSDPLASVHASIASLGEQMLAGFQSLGGALAEMKGRQDEQQEQIDAIANAPQPVRALKRQVSRGKVRFFASSRNYRIWLKPLRHVRDDRGNIVADPDAKLVEFTNSVYDVDAADETTLDQLRSHKSFGKRFWEDPTAKPVSGVTVQDGPKSTGRIAAAKPSAELVATL